MKSIISKIQALLSKTVENGATQDEFLAAAEKARELIEKYQIDDVALNIREQSKGSIKFYPCRPRDPIVVVIKKLNEFCGTRGGYNRSRKAAIFYGAPDDVAFVTSLFDSLMSLRDRGVSEFKKSADYVEALNSGSTAQSVKMQYTIGFCANIILRLDQLIKARKVSPESKSLIVLRDDLLANIEKQAGIEQIGERNHLPAHRDLDYDTAVKGFANGEKLVIGRQISGFSKDAIADA